MQIGQVGVEGFTYVDWAGSPGYHKFIGGNLITWKSKKQTILARSNAEAQYRQWLILLVS
jgi:hypothetical protein